MNIQRVFMLKYVVEGRGIGEEKDAQKKFRFPPCLISTILHLTSVSIYTQRMCHLSLKDTQKNRLLPDVVVFGLCRTSFCRTLPRTKSIQRHPYARAKLSPKDMFEVPRSYIVPDCGRVCCSETLLLFGKYGDRRTVSPKDSHRYRLKQGDVSTKALQKQPQVSL